MKRYVQELANDILKRIDVPCNDFTDSKMLNNLKTKILWLNNNVEDKLSLTPKELSATELASQFELFNAIVKYRGKKLDFTDKYERVKAIKKIYCELFGKESLDLTRSRIDGKQRQVFTVNRDILTLDESLMNFRGLNFVSYFGTN